jgi:HSP20 family protein
MNLHDLVPWRRGRAAGSYLPEESAFRLQDRFDRMFEDLFQGFGLARAFDGPFFGNDVWPRVNVSESDDFVRVEAELPGVAEQDLDVSLTEGTLVIRGEKHAESTESGQGWQRIERGYGSFQRAVALPCDVADDGVNARLDKGVLVIELRKAEPARPASKRIPVRGS